MTTRELRQYQRDFIDFLVQSEALLLGDCVTKSGRNTPYFVNTGKFDTGEKISRLSKFYADHIMSLLAGKIDVIFGPAYKGIPLCVACAAAIHQHHNTSLRFVFDRKEAKDHGDKGKLVGSIHRGDRVLVIEDVITAGKKMLAEAAKA